MDFKPLAFRQRFILRKIYADTAGIEEKMSKKTNRINDFGWIWTE